MIKIALSGQLDIDTIHQFVPKFIDNERQPLGHEYEVDVTKISFVKPEGVTALANIISYLMATDCNVTIRVPAQNSFYGAAKYLDDCGFFELFLKQRLVPTSACRDTTIQLRSLVYSEYDAWLRCTVIPWLSNCIKLDIERNWPSFSTVLGEIFNNVNDHAGDFAQIATTMMQHFPKINRVEIAISDFGIGIPSRVRSVKSDIVHDVDTIMQAVQDNFSSKTTPRNRGAGLDTVIQNAVHFNQGMVIIMSGYGAVKFTTTQTVKRKNNVSYPGTLLHLSLRTDTINHEDYYQEDLSW